MATMQADGKRIAGFAAALAYGVWVAWPSAPYHPAADAAVSDPSEADRAEDEAREERAAARRDGPNVVVVVLCTALMSEFGTYGGGQNTTPWFDALAGSGTAFEDVISASSWSGPAIASLITGDSPPDLQESSWVLPASRPTLAQTLGSQGWTTLGVSASPYIAKATGMARGLGVSRDGPPVLDFRTKRLRAGRAVRQALTMLDERRGKSPELGPFYLQLVLADTHAPRRASRAGLQRFESEGARPALVAYRSVLHTVDSALAQLDEGLAARGFTPENTLLVVVGDHGEDLEEAGGHGRSLAPSTVQVPWVLRGPGVAVGSRVEGLASTTDLVPTLLGLLKLGPGEGRGQDWSGWVSGSESSPLPRGMAFASTRFGQADLDAVYSVDSWCVSPVGDASGKCSSRQDGTPTTDPMLLQQLSRWRSHVIEGRP